MAPWPTSSSFFFTLGSWPVRGPHRAGGLEATMTNHGDVRQYIPISHRGGQVMNVVSILRESGILDAGVLAEGLRRGWIERDVVISFALEHFQAGDKRFEIVSLGSCEHDDISEIMKVLDGLASAGELQSAQSGVAMRRWIFAFVKDIAQSSRTPDEKLDAIESLYADLGYPRELDECSRYYVPREDRERPLRVGDTTASPMRAVSDLIEKLADEFGV